VSFHKLVLLYCTSYLMYLVVQPRSICQPLYTLTQLKSDFVEKVKSKTRMF